MFHELDFPEELKGSHVPAWFSASELCLSASTCSISVSPELNGMLETRKQWKDPYPVRKLPAVRWGTHRSSVGNEHLKVKVSGRNLGQLWQWTKQASPRRLRVSHEWKKRLLINVSLKAEQEILIPDWFWNQFFSSHPYNVGHFVLYKGHSGQLSVSFSEYLTRIVMCSQNVREDSSPSFLFQEIHIWVFSFPQKYVYIIYSDCSFSSPYFFQFLHTSPPIWIHTLFFPH